MILVEKAKRLAESGEKLVFIVCYDLKNKDEQALEASDHFLFQWFKRQFAKYENITLEFYRVWDAVDRIEELMILGENVFVDEFSFESDQNAQGNNADILAESMIVPEVSKDGHATRSL